MSSDAQIEKLADAFADCVLEAASQDSLDSADILCASIAFSVRFALGAAKSPEAAKSVIITLLDDYLEQAQQQTGTG